MVSFELPATLDRRPLLYLDYLDTAYTAPHYRAGLDAWNANTLGLKRRPMAFGMTYLSRPAPLPPVPDALPEVFRTIPNPYRSPTINAFLGVARRGERCPFYLAGRVYQELQRLRGYHARKKNPVGVAAYELSLSVFFDNDDARQVAYAAARWAISRVATREANRC